MKYATLLAKDEASTVLDRLFLSVSASYRWQGRRKHHGLHQLALLPRAVAQDLVNPEFGTNEIGF